MGGVDRVSITFGDGVLLDDELVSHIRALTWEHTVPVRMQTGDLMCLDNVLAGHSRMGFVEGSSRVHMVSMFEPAIKNIISK